MDAKNKYTDKFSYDGLCISSGGQKGLAVCGVLAILEMHGYLRNINYYSGCSVGSVITFLMACGWKPIELYLRAVKIKLFNGLSGIDLEGFKTKFGIMNNDLLRKELEELTLMKRKKLPTLLDLYNEGKYLAFSICDRRTRSGHKVDCFSDPTLLGTEAVLMSSNVPFVFQPIEFRGMKVIDGALTNPFPVDYIDNNKRKILGIVIYGNGGEDDSLINYATGTIMIQIEEMQRVITRYASKHVDILETNVVELNMLDSSDSYSLKNQMFFSGMKDGKLLVKVLKKRERKMIRHRERKLAKEKSDYVENSREEYGRAQDRQEEKEYNSKLPKAKLRMPIKYLADDILIKCLMSQPLDVLCQAALTSQNALKKGFSKLPKAKVDRIKELARAIMEDEIKSGSYVPKTKTSSRRSSNKEDSSQNNESKPQANQTRTYNSKDQERVIVNENYSQKLFDTLPLQFKSMAKVMVDSMDKDQAAKTISGINIIFEGLNRLGFDVFNGFLLSAPRVQVDDDSNNMPNSNNDDPPTEQNAHRVELLPDEKPRNKMQDID